MLNGEEHHLAADSLRMITDWCKDIRRAVDDAKTKNSAYNIESVENTYEVVEAYDVNKGRFLCKYLVEVKQLWYFL